jgi:glycine hydroxymethyltransferase
MTQITTPPAFDPVAASTACRNALDVIAAVEPDVASAMRQELSDQRESLKLIASENYASPAVLLAMGSWLSDKYAEGTIGHRFYAGCRNVDTVEQLAADHARALFGAPHAYVQPHSGIDANLVAFWAVLAQRIEGPGLAAAGVRQVNDLSAEDWAQLRRAFGNQRMIGMSLDAGGHLTHGFRPNISGKMFDQMSYGTDPETGLLDYDEVRRLAREFRPLILMAGYSAYPTRSTRPSSSTWRTSPAWSPARCSRATSTPCHMRTSRRRRPTSRCAARAAAWCCASPNSPTPSIAAVPSCWAAP